ncbi:MAG TPA: hypothetical protein VNK95_16900, partial [Caldilineaceae bacterium]|nr:hypothetical protein [Caldilineaceae bacterium]
MGVVLALLLLFPVAGDSAAARSSALRRDRRPDREVPVAYPPPQFDRRSLRLIQRTPATPALPANPSAEQSSSSN